MDFESLLEESIEIGAAPAQVWALVSDVRRYPEWSPYVVSTRLRGGAEEVALGVEFTNLNQIGDLEWKTVGEVVRLVPEQEIAFRIAENWVVWSFSVSPSPAGTLLRQRRETPQGISPLSLELTEGVMGGQEAFTATTRTGMRETLVAVKAQAERQG